MENAEKKKITQFVNGVREYIDEMLQDYEPRLDPLQKRDAYKKKRNDPLTRQAVGTTRTEKGYGRVDRTCTDSSWIEES